MTKWVVPGAPLPAGKGWRIWYSWPKTQRFRPAPVRVWRGGRSEPATQTDWNALPAVNDLERRVGVLTVELDRPSPGATYDIDVPETRRLVPLKWRSLPATLDNGPVTFLLASCFWRNADKEGIYSAALRDLVKRERPLFKFLAGDQVYLDWPVSFSFWKSAMEITAGRYEQYWGDAKYREALLTCPTLYMCDDHEFWNNYPERQIQLQRTWSAASRAEYASAAQILYHHYQVAPNGTLNPWYSFRIANVSFFVADTRSERDRHTYSGGNIPHFIQDQQWQDLETWFANLNGPGVLVLGQPLFQKDGDSKDYSLSNFREDYGRLCALIEKAIRGAFGSVHDILVLSGDIHTGRYVQASVIGLPEGRKVREFIASPTARIWPGSNEPSEEPGILRARHQGRQMSWRVDRTMLGEQVNFATTTNNAAVIKIERGTNGRVRFDLSLWPVVGGAGGRPLFTKTLQLR